MTPAPGKELRLKIIFEPRVVYRALLREAFRTKVTYMLVIFFPVLIFNLFYETGHPLAGLLTAACLALLCAFGLPALGTRRLLRAPATSGGVTYVFSDSGVLAEYAGARNFAEWSYVRGALETSDDIIVRMARGFHLIPKSQITSEEAAELRGLLRGHVSTNVKLA
jgi:hypothetical protein